MQVGNTSMGEVGAVAVAPVTEEATPEPVAPPVVVQPRRLKVVKPAYTKLARVEGIEGEVILRLSIDTKGRVVKAVVIKKLGFGLDEAARKACLQWRYSPKTIDGKPVRSSRRGVVQFLLDEL